MWKTSWLTSKHHLTPTIEAMNKVIAGFHNSLQADKEALSVVCVAIKVQNADLNASILTKIENLQEDLAIENKIMDQLVETTQKTKFLSV